MTKYANNPGRPTPYCDALRFEQDKIFVNMSPEAHTKLQAWRNLAYELERELSRTNTAMNNYIQSLVQAKEEIRRLEKKARVFADTINQLTYLADDLKNLDRKL